MFIFWYSIYTVVLVTTLTTTPLIINSLERMANTDLYYLAHIIFVVLSAIIYSAVLWVGFTGHALRLICRKLNPILAITISILSIFMLTSSYDQMIDLFGGAYNSDFIFLLDALDSFNPVINLNTIIMVVVLYYFYCVFSIIKEAMYKIFDYFEISKEGIKNFMNKFKLNTIYIKNIFSRDNNSIARK